MANPAYSTRHTSTHSVLSYTPNVNYSIGTFTHSSGDYYLIKMEVGLIWAAKLLRTNIGEELNTKYLADYAGESEKPTAVDAPSDQLKTEAYLLGQSQSVSQWVQIGTYTVEGNPIYYGWNFNWTGDKAVIVLHFKEIVAGVTQGYTTRKYELTVTEIVGDDILSASVVATETAVWQPTLTEPLCWFPSSSGTMFVKYWLGCSETTVAGYGSANSEAPLYAFYAADGTQRTARYSKEAMEEIDYDELRREASRAGLCPTYGFEANGPGTLEAEFIRASEGTESKLWIDGASSEVAIQRAPGGLFMDRELTRTDEGTTRQGTCNIASTVQDGTRETFLLNCSGTKCKWEWTIGDLYDITRHNASVGGYNSMGGRLALVIPWHSTECAYILGMQHTYASLHTQWQESLDQCVSIASLYYFSEEILDGPYGWWLPKPVLPEDDDQAPCVSTVLSFAGCGYTSYFTTGTDTDTVLRYDIDMQISTAYEDIAAVSERFTSYGDIGQYLRILEPALCGDLARPLPINALQSAMGNIMYTDELVIDGTAYETDTNTNLDSDLGNDLAQWIGIS